MAEIAGLVASSITLAALFKTCLDAIDLIQTAQHQEVDLKKLVLRLNIEKCRLYAWGQAMGFDASSDATCTRPLDSCPDHIRTLVRDTLFMTLQLFMDTHKLKDRYGCRELRLPTESARLPACTTGFGPIENLAASFSQFRVKTKSPDTIAKLALTTRWVIYDRKKFITLVAEVRTFVDGLRDITESLHSVTQQESTIRRRVQQIDDLETLDLVAEVCIVDHPAIYDAASERSMIMSLAPAGRQDIEQWASDIVAGVHDQIAELELLTVTELKHRMVTERSTHLAAQSQMQTFMVRLMSVLTLLYLPASFFSTLFGMGFSDLTTPVFGRIPDSWKLIVGAAVPFSVSLATGGYWVWNEINRYRRHRRRGDHDLLVAGNELQDSVSGEY